MKSIMNILQIWYNELTTVMRDKGILIFILFVPLAYPLLYSYVYTNEVVRDVPAAVVDESNSALSREFIRKMDASPDVNKDIKVERHLHATTDRQEEITRMPIEYDYVPLFNPQSGFAAFLIPPVLMLIIQQTLLLGIGMSAGNTREEWFGSFIPFHHAYKSPIPIVTGKMLFYFLLYFVLGIYMFTFVTRSFSLPQLGDYGTFLAFLVPYLLACIFLAIVLSTLVYRREDCIMIFVFLSVPLLFLSGISWPEASFPVFWKYVSWLFPSTFGLNGYVRIQGMGASLHDVAFEYCGLWIQAGVYFLLACLLYRRQILHLTINKSSK